MKKTLLIILGLILISLSVALMLYPVKQLDWYHETLDSEHAERFVTVAVANRSPFVSWFDEKDRGGVLYSMAKSTGIPFLNDLKTYFSDSKMEWNQGNIDEALYAGMFVSSVAGKNGRIHVAYQDSSMGKERLVYALYDGKIWKKETVDDAITSGINVGAYASISLVNNQPVIFYHTEQGQKFGYAKRVALGGPTSNEVGPRWEKKTLETGKGWTITSDSCKGKTYVSYRGRGNQALYFGLLDNLSWNERSLEASTSMWPALTTTSDCHPLLGYFDPKTSKIVIKDIDGNRDYDVADGSFSTISLSGKGNTLNAVYHVEGKGLFVAKSPDQGKTWESKLLAPGKYAGRYNAIATDPSGNIYIAYIDGHELKYAQYNTSAMETVKKLKTTSALVLFLLGLILIILNSKLKIKKAKVKLPARNATHSVAGGPARQSFANQPALTASKRCLAGASAGGKSKKN